MSSAILAPLGYFLTYKSNKDSVVLNTDVYISWFKRVFGVRSVRHLSKKEVIIHDPDYQRLPFDLNGLSEECRAYMQKNRLAKAPNYFSLWMSGGQDQEIIAINSRMEALVDEMSNTRSLILLQKLEKYPIIPVNAHVRPFHNYWINMAIGIVIPIGLFFYFRIWAFRIRLNKDMERIIALNRDVELTIKDINNENKI